MKRHLPLPSFLLHLFGLDGQLWIFGLYPLYLLINVTEKDKIQVIVPLSLLFSLLGLIWVGFNSLLHFVHILLSLNLLIFKGVPVD